MHSGKNSINTSEYKYVKRVIHIILFEIYFLHVFHTVVFLEEQNY